jgi:hypothetical protein
VQSDAPSEVIRASYRALMALHHPDVGGDHATAALTNEAYGLLSDPVRRTAYDAQRATRASRADFREQRRSRTDAPATGDAAHPVCPVCRLATPAVIRADTRCARCRAPLAAVKRPADEHGPIERRGMPRVSKSDWALLHMHWPSEVIDIRMRDLSLDGISVYCGAALPVHRTVRVVGNVFDVVADIVSCRRVGKVFTLHGRLITALFTAPAGAFVSTSA